MIALVTGSHGLLGQKIIEQLNGIRAWHAYLQQMTALLAES